MNNCNYRFFVMPALLVFQLSWTNNRVKEKQLTKKVYIISLLTKRIHFRSYLIARMNRAASLLVSWHENLSVKRGGTSSLNQCAQRLELFASDWRNFVAYRKIMDESFDITLVKEIFSIIKRILQGEVENYKEESCIERMLDVIDEIVDSYGIGVSTRGNHKPRENDSESDGMPNGITTDNIATRFYVLKRLAKAFGLLKVAHNNRLSFDAKREYWGKNDAGIPANFDDIEDVVTHEHITQVLAAMIKEKNVTPLLGLWYEVQQYRYAEDSQFLGQMLMMLFGAYKNLLVSNVRLIEEKPKITQEMEHVLDLYEHMNTLSTEQLLVGIDKSTDTLSSLLQEIEATKSLYQRAYDWFWAKKG